MNKKRYRVQSDVFDIVKEIKKIDKNYEVYYAPTRKMFEITYGQSNKQLELSVKTLDRSVIHKLLSTRTTPYLSKQLFLKVERENEQNEKKKNNDLKDATEYQLKNMYRYLSLHSNLSGALEDKWY